MSFNNWMNSIVTAGKELIARRIDKDTDIISLCEDLSSNKGEAMGTALAFAVTKTYHQLSPADRLAFFNTLLTDYSVDPQVILNAAEVYKKQQSTENLAQLDRAIQPPRLELFRRINMSPSGTETLVTMRRDILRLLPEHKSLKAIDNSLKYLLESWFNRGFLEIRTIDWKTPAHILEKLIAYEAVHEMNGWDDLRRRLADDRRCFAFFHPALADEPLIFVEVALVNGIAKAVQPLLAPKQAEDELSFDTAIFYSISNCQQGLQGISFGNFLIKQVVMELSEELPSLKQFATLSPIPGFMKWLRAELAKPASEHFSRQEQSLLDTLKQSAWPQDDEVSKQLKPLLLRLCTHYLYHEKKRGLPLDPVARFHLGNGALIEQINWLGDTSENGLQQSAGMLVNYRYELTQVEAHHEAFINQNHIATSKAFAKRVNELAS